MPEQDQRFTYSHQEIAEQLVKLADIHEGLWGLYIEFAIAGANIVNPANNMMTPAAIVPVLKIGIQRFPEANSMTVDAAVVNPVLGQAAGQQGSVEDSSEVAKDSPGGAN